MRHAHLVIAALLAFLFAQAGTASAAVIPVFSYSNSGSGTGSYGLTPSPSTSASASPGQFDFSIFNYYFYVAGSANVTATVDVSGQLMATESFTGPGIAGFSTGLPLYDDFAILNIGRGQWVSGSPGVLFAGIGAGSTRSGINGSNSGGQVGYTGTPTTTIVTSNGGLTKTQTTTLTVNGVIQIPTNTLFDVELYAYANGGYNSPGTLVSSASDWVDPVLTLDSSFIDSNPGYSLAFSANVGNSPATSVPEPLTVFVFGAGLIGAFTMRRRATRQSRPSIA